MQYRNKLKSTDVVHLKEILISTGFFYDSEVEIVDELSRENLEKGEEESGYVFNVAEQDGIPVAFTCYGPIPGTQSSFDLYWIVVHSSLRGKGIGKVLMQMAQEDIKKRGGDNIWVETSSRPLYTPTQQFYLSIGCIKEAELPDFYGKDDNKIIYRIKA